MHGKKLSTLQDSKLKLPKDLPANDGAVLFLRIDGKTHMVFDKTDELTFGACYELLTRYLLENDLRNADVMRQVIIDLEIVLKQFKNPN